MNWISTREKWPEDDTPVLIVRNGEITIGMVGWEYPGFEESYAPFQYWDSVEGGEGWDMEEITHWMSLPELPPNTSEPQNFEDL